MATGTGASGLATERAPSFSLPLRYFLLGIASYLAATLGWMAIAPEALNGSWSPHLLGVTHLLTLGLFLSVIMGACYQLIPVVLLVEVWSEDLGKGSFWGYLVGVLALVTGFWTFKMPLLVGGAVLVGVALAVFMANMAMSLRRAQANVTGAYMAIALTFVAVAAALGVMRVLELWQPGLIPGLPNALVAHAHAAAFGGVSLLIFGVTYRLVPMFALTHGHDRFERVVLPLAGSGALAMLVGALGASAWLSRGGVVLAVVGIALWVIDLVAMMRGRTRRRLDVGLAYAYSAMGYLLAATVVGLLLAGGWLGSERWSVAYALLGLVGWVTWTILGQLYKILPFLAWFHRYSALVGKKKVPLIRDLFSEKLAWTGFWASHAGLVGSVGGMFGGPAWELRLAGGLLSLGALCVIVTVYQTLTR